MESFCVGHELSFPKTAHSKRSDMSPEPKVRVKSVVKMFPAPFQQPKNAVRKNSLFLKSNAQLAKSEDKPHEPSTLPNLYSVMRQMTKEKLHAGGQTPSLPSLDPDTEDVPSDFSSLSSQQCISIEKKRLSLKNEMFLRGNSLDIDQKQAKKTLKHKHSLATFSRAAAMRPRRVSGNLPGNLRLKKRSTIAVIEPESVPAITLSLIEPQQEESRIEGVQRQAVSSGNLLGPPGLSGTFRGAPKSIRSFSPVSSMSSEGSKSGTPKSTIRSGEASDADSSFDSSFDMSQGTDIWSPWSSRLTPFHDLIDMSGRPPKVYHYLKRKKGSLRAEPDPTGLFDTSFSRKTAGKEGVPCTCPHPMQIRNMRKFTVQGISRLNLSLNVRKLSQLQVLVVPSQDDPSAKFLLIHVDGVVADVQKSSLDKSPYNYYLRPAAVDGLRLLSRSFSLIFLSHFSTPRFYKILDYLIQRKVTISGAYCILSSLNEERFQDPAASYFQDYTQVYKDLHIKHAEVPHRVMVIGALRSEFSTPSRSESLLYSTGGVGVRLHAKYLPVVMPAQGANVVTMLIPHLQVEGYDSAVKMTAVAKEIGRISKAAKSAQWDDCFQALQNHDSFSHVTYIRTHKIAEAYYSYLLPVLRTEDCADFSPQETTKPPLCNAHPVAQSIASLLTESRVIVVSASTENCVGKCEVVENDSFVQRAKATTLMEFSTAKEPSD